MQEKNLLSHIFIIILSVTKKHVHEMSVGYKKRNIQGTKRKLKNMKSGIKYSMKDWVINLRKNSKICTDVKEKIKEIVVTQLCE